MEAADQAFIRYLQERNVSGGVVIGVSEKKNILRSILNKRSASIVFSSPDLRMFSLSFDKVQSTRIKDPEGMKFSSITATPATPPLYRFVFLNPEPDSDRYLEVLGRDSSVIELTDDEMFFGVSDPVDRQRRGDKLRETLRLKYWTSPPPG